MFKIKFIPSAILMTAALLVLGGCSASAPPTASQGTDLKISRGLGETSVFRVGPGKDEKGEPIYSMTTATASALFDKDGKVLDVTFDALEILSPNDVDHATVPKFSGWPTQPGYLGTTVNTVDTAKEQVSKWKTKRERGDKEYGLNWSVQFDGYQKFFKGKTVAEIETWFAKNTSDINARPLTTKSADPKDVAKFALLSEAEKTALADVTSGSTISLKDAHGDYIGALKRAFENKVDITLPLK